ncbi:nuclear transport factor 2 family protein [Bradyrhizobium tunisiense]|uniref:nuclear transport factor 2 family protein n=1 Tax=Bradyrhizobium tunisiense TaxID=3278709 RepID=UPI0035D5F370
MAVVKALYAAFDVGDMEKIKSLIAPDATWTYYGPEYALPFAGARKGPDGVADFFVKVDDTLTEPGASQREFIASGDQVAVPGTEESTSRRRESTTL